MLRRKRASRVPDLRRALKPSADKAREVHSIQAKVTPRISVPRKGDDETCGKRRAQTPFERELTTKRRGEIAELAFALAASRRGFGIARPYGESERYDVILDPQRVNGACCARPRLVRVQVKATAHKLHGYHQVAVKRSIKGGSYEAYRLSEIDFIAAYVIPEDAWFIFPLTHVLGLTVLLLKPKGWSMQHPYDYYREAWHLFWEADGIELA